MKGPLAAQLAAPKVYTRRAVKGPSYCHLKSSSSSLAKSEAKGEVEVVHSDTSLMASSHALELFKLRCAERVKVVVYFQQS